MHHRPWTTPCVISQSGRQRNSEATFMGAGHAIHPGSARVQSSPASPTSGSAQGTAGSVAVSRRRARGNPLAGVHAFAGRPSTRRSLDSAIVKLNEIAEEDVGRRSHRDSIRRFASVVEWTFGVGLVARPQGDSRTRRTCRARCFSRRRLHTAAIPREFPSALQARAHGSPCRNRRRGP